MVRRLTARIASGARIAARPTDQMIVAITGFCIGQAASMGSLLLAAGAGGKRSALPNSRIMIHQPSAGFQGQATDIMIHAKEILKTKQRLNEIYSSHTGQKVDKIDKDLDRDNFMSPQEALDYGLIDKIIEKKVR